MKIFLALRPDTLKKSRQALKKLLLLVVFAMGVNTAMAQILVSGTVLETPLNEPILGVTVREEGTTNGTITDLDGNYSLFVSSDTSVLIFSFVGLQTQEVVVNGRSVIDVTLNQDVTALDEIVVIGYGEVQKKDLTGAVVSLKAEDLNPAQSVSFEQSLVAKASGVQVVSTEGGPGATMKIRIRGGTSINASNDPLYVIDGFPIQGDSRGTSTGGGNSSTSPLSTIDPANIESIEVLKDASATAIYGSRGGNGVVLITTKRGKEGHSELNFETFRGVSYVARQLDVLSPQEYVDWHLEFTPWDPDNASNSAVSTFRDDLGNPLSLNDTSLKVTDWLDEVVRPASVSSYRLGFSGGNKQTNYSGSFSYLNQEGIVKSSDFERYSGNLRLDQNVTLKLKSGVSITAGFNKRNGIVSASSSSSNGRSGVLTSAILFAPVQGDTQFAGAEYDEDGMLISLRDDDISNPSLMLNGNTNTSTEFQSFGSVYLSYELLEGLTLKSTISANVWASRGKAYFSEEFGWGKTAGGRAFYRTSQGTGIINENSLNYKKKLGIHSIGFLAVHERLSNSVEDQETSATGFGLSGVNVDRLQAGINAGASESDRFENSLESFLARMNYKLRDKYLLTVSLRADGSSRFAENARWGYFPSAAVAWQVGDEPFLRRSRTFSDMKLKVSYGETGNTNIQSFRSLSATTFRGYVFNGNEFRPGAQIDRLSNPDLTWETTKQLDFGLLLGLFKNRVLIEADYYDKKTSDLLLEVPVPTSTGFSFDFRNLGIVSNKGVELSMATVNVDNDNFKWSTDFNISFNRNKILDLGGANEILFNAIGSNLITQDYIVRVGEALGSMYGYQRDGIYNYDDFVEFDGMTDAEAASKLRSDAADADMAYYKMFYTLKDGTVKNAGVSDGGYRPGMPKFQDQLTIDTDEDGVEDAADGIINSDDRTIIGSAQPKHFGGMTNNFSYKNFDLTVVAEWTYGNDIYNKNLSKGTEQAVPYLNKLGKVRNRWTPENPNTDVEGILGNSDGGFSGTSNSSFIEDGSYLRISNVTLGYNLSQTALDKIGLKSFRVYASADNLHVFTNYSGYDPNIGVGSDQRTIGLDIDSYPRSKAFRLGLKAGF